MSWAETVKNLQEHMAYPKASVFVNHGEETKTFMLSDAVEFLRQHAEIPIGIVLVDGAISERSFEQFMRCSIGFASANFVFYVKQNLACAAVSNGLETTILTFGENGYTMTYLYTNHAAEPTTFSGHLKCFHDEDIENSFNTLLRMLG